MNIAMYPVELASAGRITVIARPRGGDWLDDELAHLRASGVDILVSMLQPDEEAELDLVREPEAAARAGLVFVALPVIDRGLPQDARFIPGLERLLESLRAGKSIAVHCRMGIGRSCLVAASLLKLWGLSTEEAWARVERARGRPVPDTPEQRAFVDRLPHRL